MRYLLLGVPLLALLTPTAYAQQAPRPTAPQPAAASKPALAPVMPATAVPAAPAMQQEMKKFLVFFDWNKATLTPEARRIIATAAEDFKKTGSTRIVATGHTDTSGSAAYNMRLSVRRADAVKAELVRLGVPAGVITTIGRGQEDLLVPTKDNVREPQNRRVSIEFPVSLPPKPAPTPAPVVAAPPPPPPPPLKWAASAGAWYGYNIREKDPGNPLKSSNLVGPELRLEYSITPNWIVFADGAAFNTVGTSESNGWGYRGVGGISHVWNIGNWHPFIGPHAGYTGGKGTQDGILIGPEVGVNYDVSRNFFLYARAAYDHNFRNEWNQGIANGGLGAGYRF